MKINKENLIQLIKELPDEIQIYRTEKDNYGCIDVKIFTEQKDKEFFDWYFGM